jgi:hypothetical protein
MLSSSRVRRDLLVAGLTGAIALVLYPGAFFRGESFFERDLHLDWYPRLEAIGRCVREGAWPLWDLGVGFGHPLLADPGAQVAYPVTWLALAVPRPAAYTVFVLVHLLVAALGTARLARRLGTASIGATAAAVVFVLSGPVQSSLNLWHHFAGLAWMPWVLLGVDGAVRAPRLASTIALALFAALQGLAGSADVCAMTLALASGWVAFRLLERPRRRRRAPRALATLLASTVLAVSLTAVMWWPAAELLGRSVRRELPADVRTAWSVPVAGLWRLLAPLDPRRVPFDAQTWSSIFDRAEAPLLWSLYLGVSTLGLAAAAFLTGRHRLRAAALGLAIVVALGLALGPHGPFYPAAVSVLPGLKMFRYPTKALLPVSLLVALLAGLGLDAVVRGRLGRRACSALGLGVILAGALSALVAARYGSGGGWPIVAVSLLAGAVWLLRSRGRSSPQHAALALAALTLVDLVTAHAGVNATISPAAIFEPPPIVARINRAQGRRLYVYDYKPVSGTAERLLGRSVPYPVGPPPPGWGERQYAAAALRLYLLPLSGGLFDLEGSYELDARGLYPRPLNDLTFFLRLVEGTSVHTRLLRLGAVGTVLSLHRRGLEGLHLEAELPSPFPEPILLWRVPGALPRSWVVSGSRVAKGRRAFEVLSSVGFDPAREVLLAEGPDRSAVSGFVGSSRVLRLAPDRVSLGVQASSPGFVVLADAFDPGWRATLDGQEVPILRANVAFRAVAVPDGQHLVDMLYRPRGAARGLTVTGAGLLALLAAAATRARRGGRRRGR